MSDPAARSPAVRPRDAATLILVRRDGPAPQLLMGRRHAGHDFMPNLWVFPGGRVERADAAAPCATPLRPEVAAVFDAHCKPGRGRAIALAGVRETFEEAGLVLGLPGPPRPAAGEWRGFLALGALPDLDAIDIVGRAITPPGRAKRFDTWFLMAEAGRLRSSEPGPGCGELDQIAWLTFDEAMALPIHAVTRQMIGEALARLSEPDRPRPFLRTHRNVRRSSHL